MLRAITDTCLSCHFPHYPETRSLRDIIGVVQPLVQRVHTVKSLEKSDIVYPSTLYAQGRLKNATNTCFLGSHYPFSFEIIPEFSGSECYALPVKSVTLVYFPLHTARANELVVLSSSNVCATLDFLTEGEY